MNTIFKNMIDLRDQLPKVADIISYENDLQYPNAKFIIAGLESLAFKEDGEFKTLHAFFDVGIDGEVLWIWVGFLDDPYIDEYYLIPISQATNNYHGVIFNERNLP